MGVERQSGQSEGVHFQIFWAILGASLLFGPQGSSTFGRISPRVLGSLIMPCLLLRPLPFQGDCPRFRPTPIMAGQNNAFDMQIKLLMIGDSGKEMRLAGFKR
jgi:hypothetical protein